MDQIEMVIAAPDKYFFPFLDGQGDLAVAADFQFTADLGEFQPDGTAAIDDQRPGRQRMREHRHQYDGVQRGREDRSSCGKGIGGGACGRGNNEAVCIVFRKHGIIDACLQFDQPRMRAAADDRVIEAGELRKRLTFS